MKMWVLGMHIKCPEEPVISLEPTSNCIQCSDLLLSSFSLCAATAAMYAHNIHPVHLSKLSQHTLGAGWYSLSVY